MSSDSAYPLGCPTRAAAAGRAVPRVSAAGSRLGRAALVLLFSSGGMAFVVPYLDSRWSLGLPEVLVSRFYLLGALPALLLGVRSFRTHAGFAGSWSVLLFTLWAAATLAWVDPTERGRSLLTIVGLAITLPLAALVNRHAYHRVSALCLGLGYVLSLLVVIASDPTDLGRFGDFVVDDATVMNSNQVGCLGVIIVVLMYGLVVTRPAAGSLAQRRVEPLWLPAVIAVLALMFVIMTVSRTAGLALAVVVSLIWLRHASRLRSVIFLSPMLATIGFGALVALGAAERWQARFSDADVRTFNGRTEIWDAIWDVNREAGWGRMYGLGCGGIDKILGEELGEGNVHPVDGIRRMHSHNLYLEWITELGLVGLGLLLILAARAMPLARHLDRRQGAVWRTCLLLSLAIIGAAGVPTKWAAFPAIGAILWASLSPLSRNAEPDRR